MNKNIETFKKVKDMRADPEKYQLISKIDQKTGQPLF